MKKRNQKIVKNEGKQPVTTDQSSNQESQAGRKKTENNLPIWNLSPLFNGIDDPDIATTKKQIADNINDLVENKDQLPKMKDYELLSFVRKYKEIMEASLNLSRFASLNLCTQRDNQEACIFEKQIEEFLDKMFDNLVWLRHSLYCIPVDKKIEFLQSPKLRYYEEWLSYQLLLPPALSQAVEKVVRRMSFLSMGWHSLYKQMTSKLNFTIGKKSYTLDEISDIAHSNKDKAMRNKALKVMSEEFSRHGYIFTQALNSIYKEEDVVTKIYLGEGEKYTEVNFDALDTDGFTNGLDREDILAIASAVTDSYIPISQRFYKLLAKLQGKQSIDYNDRLQNPVIVDSKKIPWSETIEFVMNTLAAFSPAMMVTGASIINSQLIHAKPQKGKDTGAFCIHGNKPYIFLNYREDRASLLTFAHEFGHAIHHVYSEENVGMLNNSTPISMSEVASIFNEKLVFNKLLASEELSPKEKLHLLIEDVNRQIADIHRQVAFSKFELRAFRERQKGELPEERFTKIFCEEMERYLGFPLQEDAKFSWMNVPHFFNTPFYVRYYAFAGLVVNKLWQVYISGKIEDFADRYVDMLSNTGIDDINSLLEPFELDIAVADFWSSALDPIIAEIDEIERLAKSEGLI